MPLSNELNNVREAEKIMRDMGGKIERSINWSWVTFETEEKAKQCFAIVCEQIEHRGLYGNAFRFR